MYKSAVSEDAYFPPGLADPTGPKYSMQLAREESALVMYNAVQGALEKTGLHPRQIDVLVTNCSLFNPTPSLSCKFLYKACLASLFLYFALHTF